MTFNFSVHVVVPLEHAELVESSRREHTQYIAANDGSGRVAATTSLYDRPVMKYYISTKYRFMHEVNWSNVMIRPDATGEMKPYEKAKITMHGRAGYEQLKRFVIHLYDEHCAGLFNATTLHTDQASEFNIDPDDRHFTNCFNMLALGNATLVGRRREQSKFEWFDHIASLNHSIRGLTSISGWIRNTLKTKDELSKKVFIMQELFGQLVEKNLLHAMKITVELSPDGLPSSNRRFHSSASIQKYWDRDGAPAIPPPASDPTGEKQTRDD